MCETRRYYRLNVTPCAGCRGNSQRGGQLKNHFQTFFLYQAQQFQRSTARMLCPTLQLADLSGGQVKATGKDGLADIPPGFWLGRRRLWCVYELQCWLAAGAPNAQRWAVMKVDAMRPPPR